MQALAILILLWHGLSCLPSAWFFSRFSWSVKRRINWINIPWKSFIITMNSRGSINEPCGTPQGADTLLDSADSSFTFNGLLSRKEVVHTTTCGSKKQRLTSSSRSFVIHSHKVLEIWFCSPDIVIDRSREVGGDRINDDAFEDLKPYEREINE